MRTYPYWSFRPYVELNNRSRGENPYICRIAPMECGFTFAFIDNGAARSSMQTSWTVSCRLRDGGEDGDVLSRVITEPGEVTINGLADETDYEFSVMRADGACSSRRLVRTGAVPGPGVNYLHPEDPEYGFSGRYLASPSIVRLPSGRLLSSMDIHASGGGENLTLLYYSEDDGAHWQYLTELFPCFWGTLFCDGGRLYMLSMSRVYGDLQIGCSEDEGMTWSKPVVLWRSSCVSAQYGLHRGPMPVLCHNGRIMTDVQFGTWTKNRFADAVISAPSGADLMNPEHWVMSELWEPAEHPEIPHLSMGGIEGSVVASPDGRVYDFLRYGKGHPLLLEYDPADPEGMLTNAQVLDVPISDSKADVRYDPVSGCYIMIASYLLSEPKTNRNLLALMVSENLTDWKVAKFLIDGRHLDPAANGFQYVSFLIDGDDILFVCRTAYNKSNNHHDSNYQTFHRVKDFRSLL